jgi:hypothetical protein
MSSMLNTSSEQLRLAAALVHGIPGAELGLVRTSGGRVLVGRHPAADLDPCQFRRALVASSFPGGTDLAAHVTVEQLGGSIQHLGGGLYAGGPGDHWFATVLRSRVTAALLERLEAPPDIGAGRPLPGGGMVALEPPPPHKPGNTARAIRK